MFTCDDDFNEAMQAFDADLARQEVPIQVREFRALFEMCRRTGQEFALPFAPRVVDREPTAGAFSGEDLIIRVERWYKERLEGMHLDCPRLGRVVVLLQNDPWSLRVPMFYGTIPVICDPRLDVQYNRKTTINIPDQFDNLPRGVRAATTPHEWRTTASVFAMAIDAADLLSCGNKSDKYPLMRQAFLDLEATAFHLTAHPRNLGEARWSSLQVAEKTLKTIANHRDVKYSKGQDGHILSKLVAVIESSGPLDFDRKLLGQIQCGAGVRYGETPVRLDEAVAAHHAVLKLLASLRPQALAQVPSNSPPEADRPGSGTNDILSPRKPAHGRDPA